VLLLKGFLVAIILQVQPTKEQTNCDGRCLSQTCAVLEILEIGGLVSVSFKYKTIEMTSNESR
jgi:hypothetical protein